MHNPDQMEFDETIIEEKVAHVDHPISPDSVMAMCFRWRHRRTIVCIYRVLTSSPYCVPK